MSDSSSDITYAEEISFPLTLTNFPAFIVTCAYTKLQILTVLVSLSTSSFSIPINLQTIHEEKVIDLFVLLLSVSYFSKGKTSGH